MLSSSYKKKCINFHKKLTEPLQLTVRQGIRYTREVLPLEDGCRSDGLCLRGVRTPGEEFLQSRLV